MRWLSFRVFRVLLICFFGTVITVAQANLAIVPSYLNMGGYFQWYMIGGGNHFNLNHESYFRRARLSLNGKLSKRFSYMVEYDFAYRGNWRNIWLNYRGGVNNVRLGQFKMPFNSIYDKSSRYLWFTERALPVHAFNPVFRRGISYQLVLSHWTAAVSVFAPGTQTQAKPEHPYGSTQELLWIPWNKPGKVLQFGLGNWYQQINNTKTISYGSIPEASGFIRVRTVNTGSITQTNDFDVVNAEALYQYNRFASELGYLYNTTFRSHNSNPHFSGWYTQFSFFLTPNTFKYNPVYGTFGAPDNMRHALQLAFRLSKLNLNDSGFRGGKEFNTTVAINGYFFNHLKLGLDYIYANVSQSNTTINGGDNIVMFNFQFML